MLTTFHPQARNSRGFSLVEIMVGMVIGLLSMLVILQVFSVFETQKRTSTGGSDAQSAGAIALYGLQRDIRQSGYGFSSYNLFGCSVLLPSAVTIPLAPVTIIPSGTVDGRFPTPDPNTDRILVMYGNGSGVPQGDGITSQTGSVYTVGTPGTYALNDYVIAQSQLAPSPCTLTLDRITAIPLPNASGPVTVATGVLGVASGSLFNLGSAPKVLAYEVIGGSLQVCNSYDSINNIWVNCADPTKWTPLASNIVSLRAEYGRDTNISPMDGIVDQFDQTLPLNACDLARVSAIRIALVARNPQRGPAVTPVAPTWAGTNIDLTAGRPTNPVPVPIDLSNDPNWHNYRYKVFQTIVPLKNVVWMGLSC